jgi:general secretion pathway protein F
MDDIVRRGGSLSDALEVPGLNLPTYVLALVTAGEASGELAQALDDAAQQLELQRQSAEEMKSALLYPTILVVVGVLAVLLVFVGVVPRFAPMLNSARGEIPALSRWVIETGVFVKTHWQAFAYGASALVGMGWFALRQPRWRQGLLEALMKAPAVGPWLLQAELGRWATVLGALLSNRVPIVEALALSSRVLNSERLREGVNRAARSLQQGQSLTDALASQGWFPPTRLNLVRVGERSGELPKMLLALGKSQTEAARLTQKRLLTLIEPAAILTIGTVIAVVMVSVMMVITSMNQMAG